MLRAGLCVDNLCSQLSLFSRPPALQEGWSGTAVPAVMHSDAHCPIVPKRPLLLSECEIEEVFFAVKPPEAFLFSFLCSFRERRDSPPPFARLAKHSRVISLSSLKIVNNLAEAVVERFQTRTQKQNPDILVKEP